MNYYPLLYRQQQVILKSFAVESCTIYNQKKLECLGKIRPTDQSIEYTYKVIYTPPSVPKVYILNPEIEYNSKIHLYADKRLCLYYPIEQPWKHTNNISTTIVPWILEWLICYECFSITGIWPGKSVPHGEIKKEND